MSEIVLTADTTLQTGTRPSKRLRREQRIPAVVYGLSQDPVSIDVAWADLRVALTTDAGVNAVIHLEIAGEKQMSIVKDIQRHPVRRDVIHVDFLRIDPDQDVTVDVPLVMIGEAKAVTDADGMVDQTMYELTLLTRPGNVPDEIVVDITDLQLGESIKVSDLPLPEGASAVADGDESVAISLITRSTREAMARDLAAESGDEAAEEDEAVADDSGESED